MDERHSNDLALAFGVSAVQFKDVLDGEKSPANIIPDFVQNELITLREKKRDIYFRIGDIANDLITMHQGTVTNNKIYASMANFCDCSQRTVRYYAETAAFFGDTERQRYHMLSFTHFDIARNYPEDWIFVLEYAANNPQWSSKYLESQVNSVLKNLSKLSDLSKNPMCDSVRRLDDVTLDPTVAGFLGKLDCDVAISVAEECLQGGVHPVPPKRHTHSAVLVGSIADLTEKVIELLDRYGEKLPEDVKDNVVGHLVGINQEIPAITIALDSNVAK